MKIKSLLIISIFSVFNLFSQELDCNLFKNGTFYYSDLNDKFSVRTDSIQESYNKDKLEMIWKVIWVNDCEYDLVCEKILVKGYPIKFGDRINVKITETIGECYKSSLTVFNGDNPNGFKVPSGILCKKE